VWENVREWRPVFVSGQGWIYTTTVKGNVTLTVRVNARCGATAGRAVGLTLFQSAGRVR